MEQSTNYNFNLPSKNDETSADIDLISDNFRTVDDVVKQVQDDVSKIPTNLVNGSAKGSLRGINAKAEGNGYTIGQNAVAIGYGTEAIGYTSYAEGYNTTASGDYSHTEGGSTTASGGHSHAEGYDTTASGNISHAEGWVTTASGTDSHAEGFGTTASGEHSHAEGYHTTASDSASHAEGVGTIASGTGSHAEGSNTIASGYCQHAQGKLNIEDTNNRYAHIVGNGEDGKNRSNAHTLDWDGNAWFAGDVYVGGTSQDDENAIKLSSVAEKIKNHTAFSILVSDPNSKTYIKLGKFTGDGIGGRAIFTINGKVGWNNKNDGGLKVLTLSSNDSRDTTSTGIFTGGSFFDFGHSDNDGTSIIEDTPDIQVAIVRPSDYTVKEVDIYLKFTPTKYTSYLVTVDYSDTCKWETDVKPVNATDPDPMETALSAYIVPKKRFGGVEEGANKTIVDTALSTTSTNPLQNKVVTEKINSANSTITSINSALDTKVTREVAVVGSDDENSAGWYKVADGTMPALADVSMLFAVHSTVTNKQYAGILQLNLRSGSSDNITCPQLGWLTRNGFEDGQVIVTTDGLSWAMYFKVTSPRYYRTFFEVLQKSGRVSSALKNYNLYTNSTVETTAPAATFASSDLGVIKTINEKLDKKADTETGTCTLSASNGTVSNATYSVVGNMVTLNFNIAPTGAGNVVVSGLPFTTTKNQSAFASSTATYNIAANQTSVSINSTSGTAEYCTVTYLK